jgi:GNAT superfamily N-acetyltransferase
MMDVEIRHADLEDGESLLDLWHGFTAHLAEYDERYRHRESANERWLSYFENQLVDAKYGTVIVAEVDDEIVGVLEARVTGGHPIFRLSDHGSINGYYIREDYRDEGIGRQLIEEAVDWFQSRDRDLSFCRVDVLEGDQTSAVDFEALDFEPVEHVYELTFE